MSCVFSLKTNKNGFPDRVRERQGGWIPVNYIQE